MSAAETGRGRQAKEGHPRSSSSTGTCVAEVEMYVVTILCTSSAGDEVALDWDGGGICWGASTIMAGGWETADLGEVSSTTHRPSKKSELTIAHQTSTGTHS
jgi:hypothetical protein